MWETWTTEGCQPNEVILLFYDTQLEEGYYALQVEGPDTYVSFVPYAKYFITEMIYTISPYDGGDEGGYTLYNAVHDCYLRYKGGKLYCKTGTTITTKKVFDFVSKDLVGDGYGFKIGVWLNMRNQYMHGMNGVQDSCLDYSGNFVDCFDHNLPITTSMLIASVRDNWPIYEPNEHSTGPYL